MQQNTRPDATGATDGLVGRSSGAGTVAEGRVQATGDGRYRIELSSPDGRRFGTVVGRVVSRAVDAPEPGNPLDLDALELDFRLGADELHLRAATGRDAA